MTRLFFSNTANQLSLSAGVVATDTVLLFAGTPTGWPGAPCKAVIEPDTDSAEVVLVTAIGPSTFTVVRGQDGTTAQNHNSGAAVEHRWSAAEADEANLHANLDGGVHGITGDVVGTDDVQTLVNKTLVSPLLQTATAQASNTSPAVALKAGTGGANIGEWQDASGVRLSRVGPSGDLLIQPNNAAAIPLLVQSPALQSAAHVQVKDSAGNKLFEVDNKGRLNLKPTDVTSPAVKFVPPNGTDLPIINLRNATDNGDELVITTLGRISNAALAWLRGNSTEDPLRYPLDGSKFKLDSNGSLTLVGDVTAGGNLAAANLVTRIAYASGTGNSSATTGEIKDQQVGDIAFTAVAGHKYRLKWVGRVQSSTGTAGADVRIRDGGGSSPTNASTLRVGGSVSLQLSGGAGAHQLIVEQLVTGLSAGTHTIAAFIASTTGDSVLLSQATGQLRELMVYDEGTV